MDGTAPTAPVAPRTDKPDNRNRLSHILATEPELETPAPTSEALLKPQEAALPKLEDENGDGVMDPATAREDTDMEQSGTTKDRFAEIPIYTATTTTTRRNANGSVSSVYSGNKIRHLKKEDGVPLWRKDIQYDFLRHVFDDEQKVFHKVSDKTGGHTFADIYLDAMAKSSKCSKILKDKLLTERTAAINMAMVCLLVNVGRMNTTLNCTSVPLVYSHTP